MLPLQFGFYYPKNLMEGTKYNYRWRITGSKKVLFIRAGGFSRVGVLDN
jgi:hypothetical protein